MQSDRSISKKGLAFSRQNHILDTMKPYQNNTEPKIGDTVVFASGIDPERFRVISVLGGRMGNKVGVLPLDNPDDFSMEYYYYCLAPIDKE